MRYAHICNKRKCRQVNHFIDNSCGQTISDLKFILIEQVATKIEKFLKHREGFQNMNLMVSIEKKNSIRGDVANFLVDSSIATRFAGTCFVTIEIKLYTWALERARTALHLGL